MTVFVSLGIQCNVAEELKKRRKRKYSLPYDWLYIGSYNDIIMLLESRNEVLFKRELWEKNPNDTDQYKNKKLKNTGSRHFFDSELSNFYEVTEIFRKRTNRLFSLFLGNERVEFIRDQQWYILDPVNFYKFLNDFEGFFSTRYPTLDWRLNIFVDSNNEETFTSYGIISNVHFNIIFVSSDDSKDWHRPMNPWHLIFDF
tara:strand:+ start:3838 stop:4437 length:600 start_codon:yes stop_codon:yes gene_type:complete